MTINLYARTVTEALDRADARHWTRQLPRSDRARTRFLLHKEHESHEALAARLNTVEQAVTDVLDGEPLPAGSPLHARIEQEAIRQWQPVVRRRAHETIYDRQGQVSVSFRAWFGFTSAAGTTDDPRLRFLTIILHPPYGARLLKARDREESEAKLHSILGDALAATYFNRDGQPTALVSVTLKNIDYLEFFF